MDSELIEKLQSVENTDVSEAISTFRELPISDLKEYVPQLFKVLNKNVQEMTKLHCVTNIAKVLSSDPTEVDNYIGSIKESIQSLLEENLSDDGLLGSAVIQLLQPVIPKFQTNSQLLSEWLDLLFELVKEDGSVKHSAYGPIVTAAMQQPIVLKDHVPKIFEAIEGGFSQLSSSLYSLYSYNPSEYERRIDLLLNLYKTDITYQSMYLMVLNEIAKKKPSLLAKHVSDFSSGLNNPSLAASVVMLYNEVASYDASVFLPYIDSLFQAVQYNQNLIYQVPNILGLVGRLNTTIGVKILDQLFKLFSMGNDMAKGMILSEIRNVGEQDKSLLDQYISQIESLESSPQELIRDQAISIMNFYRGIDVRSLASKIEEQNEKIKNAAKSVDDLMEYVDENITELKEFIAEIAKKIPTPRTFSTEGKIRKTLILHFVCDKEGERCIFPSSRTFTTETKDWSKWLKIAFSGIKLGKSLIIPAAIGDAGKAVKDAYDAYKEKYDKDFLAYISEPFLTSSEQDNLVHQLRNAKYFDVFHYNAQAAGWYCTMCNL